MSPQLETSVLTPPGSAGQLHSTITGNFGEKEKQQNKYN
jgi:hypothetical protein